MASIKKRSDGKWRARYRDELGREHARHFARKVDAENWLDEVTAAIVTGTYVDPKLGEQTVAAFAEEWAEAQTWAATTTAGFPRAIGRALDVLPPEVTL